MDSTEVPPMISVSTAMRGPTILPTTVTLTDTTGEIAHIPRYAAHTSPEGHHREAEQYICVGLDRHEQLVN